MATKAIVTKFRFGRIFQLTLTKERYLPWMTAIILGGCSMWIFFQSGFTLAEATLLRTLSSCVTFGSITAGFIGASLAILCGINKEFKKQLALSGYIDVLKAYLRSALYSSVCLSIVGIIGPSFVVAGVLYPIAITLVMLLGFCIASLYRVCRIMFVVFTDPDTH